VIPYFLWDKIIISNFPLNVWGMWVGLGFLTGLYWTIRKARKGKDFLIDDILNLAAIVFVASLVGARIFYVLLFWHVYSEDPWEILRVWNGGMVMYGGILGAILAGFIYLRIKKYFFWKWFDLMAPGLALGIGIGRIGCFMIHDHIGRITNLPWGLEWIDGTIRHETSMYASLFGFLIFAVLIFLSKKGKLKNTGMVSSVFIIGDSIAKFIVDALRATDVLGADPRFFGLTVSQYLSILFLLLGLYLFGRFSKRYNLLLGKRLKESLGRKG
jgi:phosphatidylglycerol:prolipoprotein diacylglycerol transferase